MIVFTKEWKNMKKIFALLLITMLGVGMFTGCSNEPAPGTTAPAQTTTQAPAEDTTFVGILDETEDYTLVIETPGTSGDERIGVRCAAGNVQIGQYNKLGSKRDNSIEVAWKDLGLEGESWEYLGATFEFDVSGATPVLKNAPEKSCYVVAYNEVTLGDDAVTIPGDVSFKYADLNWGAMRPNSLINEGGKYVQGWNDLSVTADFFDATNGFYVFCYSAMYKQSLVCTTRLLPGEALAPADTDAEGTFTGSLDMTDTYTLVIETPGSSGDSRIGVLAAAGKVQVGRYDKTGLERIGSVELNWADLKLEGQPWEYLGSTFEFDTTSGTPVLTNAPVKTCFAIAFDKAQIDGTDLVLPNGEKVALGSLNWGKLRANNLLNEGGKFASGWNDLSVTAEFFNATEGGYLIAQCPKYGQSIICTVATMPAAQ